MLLQIIVAFACAVAGLAQLMAFVSPATSDLRILNVARRITGVFMLLAAVYIVYELWTVGSAHTVLCLLLGGLALGQLLFAMHTFVEPAVTERLMSRTCSPERTASGSHA